MIVLLCSGQGTQHREMFRLTGDVPAAAAVFAAAKRVLGADPRSFAQSAQEGALHSNRVAQILCVTQAIAGWMMLSDVLPERYLVAGYSVGEVAAWSIAGLLDMEQAIEVARVRAEHMDRASGPNDGLAYVRGLARERVDQLARDKEAEIAIANPANTFIVGGERQLLGEFCESALASGALRAALLPVMVAAHTSRLAGTQAPFRAALEASKPARQLVRHPGVTLLSGLDGSPIWDFSAGADALARQLGTCVRWDLCLEAAVERGATAFLELGPGRALARMAQADAYPQIPARSLEDFRTCEGVRSWVRSLSR